MGGDDFGDDIFGGVWVVMTSEPCVSDVTVASFPLSDRLCFRLFISLTSQICFISSQAFLMIKENDDTITRGFLVQV